ncbi:unnamed protein product [Clonostachys rosea f. rosea IK726]|uniref:DNA repair protein REV1 n=2 Tax=Bionectria ochroleuca TaxID=29856 RepID=A0A0B7JX79_BIOOC|nr:unnamed protein product [Clonostachys rosea f. rosea IK726]
MSNALEKNSSAVRKRIEKHTFTDETGEEYDGSTFNGFPEYFRRKKIKLQNLDAEIRSRSDKPQIFKGIVAHVSGYTQPPLHILHKEIVQHGGGFLQYLDSKTMATHIIASSLPPKKTVDWGRCRIAKPAWIVDSIAAGKLLSWTDYRVIDEGPRQKVLAFDASGSMTQTTPKPRETYKEHAENSFYSMQLKNCPEMSAALSQAVAKASRQPATPSKLQSLAPENPPLEPTAPVGDPTPDSIAENIESGPAQPPAPELPEETKPKLSGPPQNATSEEHNAWLLSDPRIQKSSTANPEFLKQYYSESRLHHLSTWKSELKSKLQKLAAEKSQTGKAGKRPVGSRRYILHVDFDSFFCAVSLKKHPELVDKPVAVAHGQGSGSEIASCNYPAREFGVRNGMWMKRAHELCSDLKVLPYDFPGYEAASQLFYEAIIETGGLIQSVSIDEALIDVSALVYSATGSNGQGADEDTIGREQAHADEIATSIRARIKEKTECNVSVGVGANILQAKVALRKAKPAGQYQLKPADVLDMIGELQVEQLPGVARSISGKLEDVGVKLVKDLRALSRERLSSVLGPKTGEKLWEYSRGIDKAEVGEQPPRKSVSAEINWGIRFLSQPEAEEFVYNLCKELERRLLNEQVKGRQLTVKIMRRSLDAPLDPAKHLGHGKCDTFNKSVSFGVSTNNYETIGKEAVSVLRTFGFSPGDLRGLGVQMTKLEPIKTNPSAPEGSQRKLPFSAFKGPPPSSRRPQTEAIEEVESPTKPTPSRQGERDPITEEPFTPSKSKVHPAMALAKAAEEDTKATTPLNVSGTQFLLPSSVDPSVFAELPKDIRSRLMAQRPASSRQASPITKSSTTAMVFSSSQIDTEVFNALPDDMKAEVLATYGRKQAQPPAYHSPRKDKTSHAFKPATPIKQGGRARNLFGKSELKKDAQAGLIQTSFMDIQAGSEDPQGGTIEDMDSEFLAGLPESIRKEVMEDHRRQRLAQKSGLEAPMLHGQKVSDPDADSLVEEAQIEFPPPRPQIPFGKSGVSSVQQIKDMLDAWHAETQADGPHDGDVEVFQKYLVGVVHEERDLKKVLKLIKWLEVLIEQEKTESQPKGKEAWQRSLAQIKKAVQGAIRKRGLLPLKL